ncbi:MAG: hypothetical protein ACE5HQ_06675 [Gemmatimonadota bacterium]
MNTPRVPERRATLLVIAVILGSGLAFLLANLGLPPVRNSFVYAKTARNLLGSGFDPVRVIADSGLSHGKPVGFSLLAAPLIRLLGANAGLKLASALGTALFLAAACGFFGRLNRKFGLPRRLLPLELVLLFFHPLALYQFWSAYPDSLFAGLVLLAFVLTDVVAAEPERDTRALIPLLGLVIYAAILTKLYGLILGIACPAYLLLHLRGFRRRASHAASKLALLGLVFGVLGVGVALARLGRNPTLNLGADVPMGGGYNGYLANLAHPSGGALLASLLLLLVTLLLAFHVSLLFLFRRWGRPRGSRARPAGSPAGPAPARDGPRAGRAAPACFAAIYVAGLLPFSGTSYNQRFFLPALAFVAVAIASGAHRTGPTVRRGILAAYAGVALLLTLEYNLAPVHRRFPGFHRALAASPLGRPRTLDNLRMDQHLGFARWIDGLNRTIEPRGVLYWTSRYYGTATHGVIEELGIRGDIAVRYVGSPAEIPPTRRAVHLAGYRSRRSLAGVRGRFAVLAPLPGVLRLVPLQVRLTAPTRDHFEPAEPIRLWAEASASADARVLRVEFLVDGSVVAADAEPPFETEDLSRRFRVEDAAHPHPANDIARPSRTDGPDGWAGRHVALARVHDSEGHVADSEPLTFFVGIRALERRIASPDDDAEELPDGFVYRASGDLELIHDPERGDQLVGLRFRDIPIARGEEIRHAHLQFTVDEPSTEPTELILQAELAGDPAPFGGAQGDLSSRPRTMARVRWRPEPWMTVGESSGKQRSPDLSALIREVTARPDWRAGHALVLLIRGSGRRVAVSYDGRATGMPRLFIERR